jgi:class 3 adenylate cyclase
MQPGGDLMDCPHCGHTERDERDRCTACGSDFVLPGTERRQLTVMFCDLVGSTGLSHEVDVEDLRELLIDYQRRVRGVIERYGG